MRQARIQRIERAEAKQQQQPDKYKEEPENIPGKFTARDAILNLEIF